MPHLIQSVLFDLGDTLMYSPNPWPPVFDQAGRELSTCLRQHGLPVDLATFPAEFRQKLDDYYVERDRNLLETSTTLVLKHMLLDKGYVEVPEEILRRALDRFYAVTQQNWFLEADTVATLSALKAAGFRLGIVSNAGDNRDVYQLIEKFNIGQYFDLVLTSAACSFRKPHPHIFKQALAHWGFVPDQAAMVGDRLDADIGGSKMLGMLAIWIKRRAKNQVPGAVFPDATVNTLSEIPPLLFNLAQ